MDTTRLSLLERVRRGDDQSWRELLTLYQPLVRNWLLGRGIISQDADDLSQDVMVVLVRKLPDFQHQGRVGSFRAWLRTIVSRQTLKFIQQGRCRAETNREGITPEYLTRLADSSSDLAIQWDHDHKIHIIKHLLRLVERDFQPETVRVFRLLTVESMKPEQVAELTGLTIAAVYGMKSRVLARLREEAETFFD